MRRNGLSCGALSEVLSTTRRARLGLRELERLVLSEAEGCPPDSRQGWRSSGTLAMVLLFGICCVNVYAAGQTEKVLYRFQGGKDGTTPIGGLVEDAVGNLYGTTVAPVIMARCSSCLLPRLPAVPGTKRCCTRSSSDRMGTIPSGR